MSLIRKTLLTAGVGVIALALAACGSSSSTTSSTTTTTSSVATGGGTASVAAVHLAMNPTLHHTILVNKNGMTLYYLTGETASHLLCTSSACLKFWPPVYLPSGTTTPAAVKGIPATKFGTVMRPGGKLQVTYNGWPLYTFSEDTSVGQDNGEKLKSFGGTWLVIQKPTAGATGTGTGTTSGGGSSSSGGGWS
jgi:predicted lipoprotein with Yx(FWY)xxD motif